MEGTLIKQKEICKWCGKEFVTLRRKRECPVCGEKFRPQSEESLYCDRCKYIGWAKRTALMEQREQMR